MHDLLPAQTAAWSAAEERLRRLLEVCGYEEIRTPAVEESRLFERSVGEATDIVAKELYAFADRKGRKLALRPEGTAPVARAYLQHGLHERGGVTRLWYAGAMFRYDRPQKDRYRQFHQVGVELFGGAHPYYDGEVMDLLARALSVLGVAGPRFEVNAVGCRVCRPQFVEALRTSCAGSESALCADCARRLQENPLRMLDCKRQECRELFRQFPSVMRYLCDGCREHFAGVREYLDNAGVRYEVNDRLVRGLDYYTRTVFEVFADGCEGAVAGGGRYDNLIQDLGGPSVPAVGWALGMERVMPLAQMSAAKAKPVRLVLLGAAARRAGIRFLSELRDRGVAAVAGYEERSLGWHLKYADREGVRWVAIIGDDELSRQVVLLRDMQTGEQNVVPAAQAAGILRERTGC